MQKAAGDHDNNGDNMTETPEQPEADPTAVEPEESEDPRGPAAESGSVSIGEGQATQGPTAADVPEDLKGDDEEDDES